MRRITELDGIRAIAILAVMGCHYYPFSTMIFRLPEFGWAGVELFFVLSGFLITSILLHLKTGPHPYKIFYLRRILRIFPPYFAVLFLVVMVARLERDSIPWLRFGQDVLFLQSFSNTSHVVKSIAHVLTGAQHVANPFVFPPLPNAIAGFPISGFSTSYSHTWSLSVEEWFYILWAPMVLNLGRRTLLYVCLAVCAAALLIRWFGFLGLNTYFVFFSHVDVLMGGALLALWTERRRSLPPRDQERGDSLLLGGAGICGLLLLAILLLIHPVLGREIRDSLLFSVVGLPLFAFCIAGLLSYVIRHANSKLPVCRLLRSKPLVTLGMVSYMLYLLHVPIYFLVTQLAARVGVTAGRYEGALTIAMVSAAVSICLSLLSFRYFEMPIVSYKDRLTGSVLKAANTKSAIEAGVTRSH